MTYVTIILGILGGILSLVTTGMTSGINGLKKKNEELTAENSELKARLAAAESKAELEVKTAVGKRDEVIAMLKAEIEILEKDLASNPDPAATRARLSKLLAVP